MAPADPLLQLQGLNLANDPNDLGTLLQKRLWTGHPPAVTLTSACEDHRAPASHLQMCGTASAAEYVGKEHTSSLSVTLVCWDPMSLRA